MDDPKVLERMRADWNRRAGQDANYFVAFGRREQEDEEFFSTASDVVRKLESNLKRLRSREAALEIGCGPGRLMRPMSRHFGEIHGVDVSDEMIRLARERLRGVGNAHPRHSSGSDLAGFADETFDYVYSYAVFQHIPSREVVFGYLREARRVLKTGGILHCQINGLPAGARQYDTWSGVRIAPEEIREFARASDLELLELEQIWTQYMWMACRKMPAGWTRGLAGRVWEPKSAIRNISNALTGEAAAPATGPLAALSLWIENLPAECDLNHLSITADGRACRGMYVGEPARDGVSQVNAALPEGIRTGLVPVEAAWLGRPICEPRSARIVPAGPMVPRIAAVTDGVDLLAARRIGSGIVKISLLEVAHPGEFRAMVDGLETRETEEFCVDPMLRRYEFNVRLPEGIGRGTHELRIALGRREFAPLAIEVA
jgi:SAM-dependent methyltransferase